MFKIISIIKKRFKTVLRLQKQEKVPEDGNEHETQQFWHVRLKTRLEHVMRKQTSAMQKRKMAAGWRGGCWEDLRTGVEGVIALGLVFAVIVARDVFALDGRRGVGARGQPSSLTHHGVGGFEFVQGLQVGPRIETPDAPVGHRALVLELVFGGRGEQRIFREGKGRRTRAWRPRQTGAHLPLIGAPSAPPSGRDGGERGGFWVVAEGVRALQGQGFDAVREDGVIGFVLLDRSDEPALGGGGRGRRRDGRIVALGRQEAVGLGYGSLPAVQAMALGEIVDELVLEEGLHGVPGPRDDLVRTWRVGGRRGQAVALRSGVHPGQGNRKNREFGFPVVSWVILIILLVRKLSQVALLIYYIILSRIQTYSSY